MSDAELLSVVAGSGIRRHGPERRQTFTPATRLSTDPSAFTGRFFHFWRSHLPNQKRPRPPNLASRLFNTDTFDLVREARELRDRIADLHDDVDADTAEIAAMNQCMSEMAQFPADDPRHVTAQKRFDYLLSHAPQAKRKFQRALKNFTRSIGNELYYLKLAAMRWLLVLGCNVAAMWLFFWLLSLLSS